MYTNKQKCLQQSARNANSVVKKLGHEAGVEDTFQPHSIVCTL